MTKKPSSLYKIILDDDSIFNGGNLTDTNWLDIPYNKKIKQLFYKIPSGDYLLLSGYDKYYFMVECAENINAKNPNRQIEYVYIMGQKKDKVICYKVDLYKNVGYVYTVLLSDDSEFIRGLNPKGWKKGV